MGTNPRVSALRLIKSSLPALPEGEKGRKKLYLSKSKNILIDTMNLLPLLILAGAIQAPKHTPHPDAVEIYRCDFGESFDVNFDLWPDDWKRKKDARHPPYLRIEIDDQTAVVGNRCLRMELDGGAATVFAPPIEVSAQFSYILEAHLKTEGLEHDVAYCSVTFYDADRQPLSTHETSHESHHPEWEKISLGPVSPLDERVRYAVIGLHLYPTNRADLRGAAMFDKIWFARMPGVTLRANSLHNVYSAVDDIEVICHVSGILDREPTVQFELRDEVDVLRASERVQLVKDSIQPGVHREDPLEGDDILRQTDVASGFSGTATWKIPVPDVGFYHVHATILGRKGLNHQRTITLVAIQPHQAPVVGEFGWSLPNGDQPLSLEELPDLLGMAGINWVKFPVWLSEDDSTRADGLVLFAEQLHIHGIEMIGLLDQPPPGVRSLFTGAGQLQAAQIFEETELWHPVLYPVLTRLSLKVRWWQLGRDDDLSFVGYPGLVQKITEIKKQLELFGQEFRLGIGWRWMYEPPTTPQPPWAFLSYWTDPPLTPEELSTHLSAGRRSSERRWVTLTALPRDEYDINARSRDLVQRMLSAKINMADAIIFSDPFDQRQGLMNADGTPSELFLPWRTTALMLSGRDYLGSIELPNGSTNHIFDDGRRAVMLVWNDTPVQETIFLGTDVQIVDLWGRKKKLQQDGFRQVIPVGREPIFVVDVNPKVARWRMGFNFDNQRLASAFGRAQSASYHLNNPFHQGVSGSMTLRPLDVWDTDFTGVRFKLAENEEFVNSFNVTLGQNARSGNQKVRVDFDLTADRRYRFSVHRRLDVGPGDVAVEVTTHMDESGNLLVHQQLMNHTDNFFNFDCFLFAPKRRRQRFQVLNLGRGYHTQTYALPRGEELVGKMVWLRVEEIGGERVLNHSFTVEP